jgi:hypothetical protein
MKHTRKIAQLGMLSVAGAALFACAPDFGDSPEWQPSAGTHAVEANLLPSMGYYESAVNAINGRHYALALDYLQAARAAKPDDVRVLTAFGVVYDKLGRFDLSARYYAQAATLDPKSTIITQDLDYSHRLQVMAQGPVALTSTIAAAANVPKVAQDAAAADTIVPHAPWLLASETALNAGSSAVNPHLVTARVMPVLTGVVGNIVTTVNFPKMAPEATVAEAVSQQSPAWLQATNAAPLNSAAWNPVKISTQGVPSFPSVDSNIVTTVNIPKMALEATVAEAVSQQQPPWLQTVKSTFSNNPAWKPVTVSAHGVPSFPSGDGNIVTAVNIPTFAPETTVAEAVSQQQAPWLQTAKSASSNNSAWKPVMVRAHGVPSFPSVDSNIVTAVNIPKMAPEATVAEAASQQQPPSLQTAKSTSSNDPAWKPVTVSAHGVPSFPSVDGNIVTVVNIPKFAPETTFAKQVPQHTPWLQTAKSAPSNTSAWKPVMVSAQSVQPIPSVDGNIVMALNVPTMAFKAAATFKNSLQALAVLTVRAVSSTFSDRIWHPMPISLRPAAAVPPSDAQIVVSIKIPEVKSQTFVADAKPLEIPKPQSAMHNHTVILIGHPLVLVNASGRNDTPMSVGRRLSRLGWSVAKSVEDSPKVQTRTTIIYQKSKSAAAMALARTMSLFPRLTASQHAIGLRLVLGSDLSGSMSKKHLPQVSGTRIRLADTRYQSRE